MSTVHLQVSSSPRPAHRAGFPPLSEASPWLLRPEPVTAYYAVILSFGWGSYVVLRGMWSYLLTSSSSPAVVVSERLEERVKMCEIRSQIYGASDHCPVVLELAGAL